MIQMTQIHFNYQNTYDFILMSAAKCFIWDSTKTLGKVEIY